MRIPGVKTAKSFSRWLRARILGGGIILGYHRVADVTADEYEICVSRDHFEQHMDAMSRYARPIRLSEMVAYLIEGSLPPRSVAVTFDDGYVDNLHQAKPILEKYQIPATVFVCTGYMGKMFWWDELDQLIMTSRADLRTLDFRVGKRHFQWNPFAGSARIGLLDDVAIRRKLRHALYNFLLSMDAEEQVLAMDILRNWSGSTGHALEDHRAMNEMELLALTEGGLVDLGAHTRTHPVLPRLSPEKQQAEIGSSKQELEALTGRQVAGFAYPNGKATGVAKQIVQDAGFTYACTSLHDMVRPGCDTYELTRFWQKDVNGDRFIQNLRLWMGPPKR